MVEPNLTLDVTSNATIAATGNTHEFYKVWWL